MAVSTLHQSQRELFKAISYLCLLYVSVHSTTLTGTDFNMDIPIRPGDTLICDSNKDCSILCQEISPNEKCSNVLIYAPLGATLRLDCWMNGCSGMNVYGADTGNVDIICRAWYGCWSAVIHALTNGDLSLHCDTRGACIYMNIICPVNGACTIDGFQPSDTRPGAIGMTVNATNMVSGDLVMTVDVGMLHILTSDIYCPGNDHDCIVSCNTCEGNTFYTQHDTSKLYIYSSVSLTSSTIYCPIGSGTCWIEVNGTGTDMVSNVTIYAQNGLTDVQFICNYTSDASQCYDNLFKPKLFCGDDFNVSCDIELKNGYNDWQCSNQEKLICQPTKEPTKEPTQEPTTFHTESTSFPTQSTSFPTESTSFPTQSTPLDEKEVIDTPLSTLYDDATDKDVKCTRATLWDDTAIVVSIFVGGVVSGIICVCVFNYFYTAHKSVLRNQDYFEKNVVDIVVESGHDPESNEPQKIMKMCNCSVCGDEVTQEEGTQINEFFYCEVCLQRNTEKGNPGSKDNMNRNDHEVEGECVDCGAINAVEMIEHDGFLYCDECFVKYEGNDSEEIYDKVTKTRTQY